MSATGPAEISRAVRAVAVVWSLLATLSDLEELTSAWVHWYNNERLMHRLGRRPPAEAEADYYATTDPANPPVHTN
jgi:transposase InsO family protein